MSDPLRVRVVVDGPRWQLDWATRIAALAGVTVEVAAAAAAPRAPLPLPLALYRAIDQRIHSARAAAFLPSPVPSAAGSAPADLVLDLTGRSPRPADAPRHGVWRVRWGRGEGAYAGLAEMLAREDVTRSTLEQEARDGGRVTIATAVTATHPYSLVRSRGVAVAAMASIVVKHVARIRDGRAAPDGGDADGVAGTPRSPGVVTALAGFAGAFVQRIWERLFVDEFQWSVSIVPRRPGSGPEAHVERAGAHRMPGPPGHFQADPFVFEREGRSFVFFEDYDYRSERGRIAWAEIDGAGRAGAAHAALERPYHLSWPQVFEHGGAIFMVPETWSRRAIELYRCRAFPDDWVLDQVLIEGFEAADPLVFEHQGRWWILCCVAPAPMSPDTELHAFHAPTLRGPWSPHALNPVLSDVRGARPAGRPWRRDGAWFRAAQDCSVRYGHGLAVKRILALDPDAFREETVARLGPERSGVRGARGMHTWNAGERYAAFDVCVARPRLARGRATTRDPEDR